MPLTFVLAFDVAVVVVFQPSAERTVSLQEKRISAPSQCSIEKDTTAQRPRYKLKLRYRNTEKEGITKWNNETKITG